MREMRPEEARTFLMHGTRTGKLAIVRRDGSPMVVPVWFLVDADGSIVFTTGSELPDWATRIAARYMGPAQADAYGHRNAVPGELLVRLRPDRVVALADIAG